MAGEILVNNFATILGISNITWQVDWMSTCDPIRFILWHLRLIIISHISCSTTYKCKGNFFTHFLLLQIDTSLSIKHIRVQMKPKCITIGRETSVGELL